jgi:hypothetical protein
MRFVDNELDILVDRLQERTNDWLGSCNTMDLIKGNIGEKLVGYCICHGLWKLGYSLNLTDRLKSYNIQPRYRADASGYRGIDFLLTIIDSNRDRHVYLIEVKNWDNYIITPDTFNDEILSRFTRVDRNRRYNWILVMNARNWRYIRQQCDNEYIFSLRLPKLITHNDVFNSELIEDILKNIIEGFCSVVTEISSDREYPYLTVENRDNRAKWDMIAQDILMGVSYDVIESRYNTSKSYISKCASRLRRRFPDLPDRRNRDWRVAWEVQD